MLVSYYGLNSPSGFTTDPRALNESLKRQVGGYSSGHDVSSSNVAQYARGNGVDLWWVDTVWGMDNALLDAYLRTGFPVILGVSNVGHQHYVLATGKLVENGVAKYSINDPLVGQTTLDLYGGVYNSMVLMSNVDLDQRHLRVSGHSPIELMVTDPDGRRVGYDPRTRRWYSEIPGASYYVWSLGADDGSGDNTISKVLDVPSPVDGVYKLQIAGIADGRYTIDYTSTRFNGRSTTSSFASYITFGAVEVVDLTYTSTYYPLYLPFVVR